MQKQLVQLSIINNSLNLHPDTPLLSTLSHISDLLTFRQQHLPCNNIIFNLRDQLTHLQGELLKQQEQYLREKVKMAREEAERLFRVREEEEMGEGKWRREGKVRRVYAGVEEFMREEYQIEVKKKQEKGRKLGVCKTVNAWILAVEQPIKDIQSTEGIGQDFKQGQDRPSNDIV